MISLLPDAHKKDLRASRTNTVLLRYNILLVFAVMFLAGASIFVYIFLGSIKTSAETTIQENLAKESSFSETKQQAELFRSSLSDAKTIFDSELSYSTALIRYANLFPEGTAVESISLSDSSFGTPQDVVVKVTGQSAASTLTTSLANSPYVENFSRKSIAIVDDDTYPFSVSVTFTLKKDIATL